MKVISRIESSGNVRKNLRLEKNVLFGRIFNEKIRKEKIR